MEDLTPRQLRWLERLEPFAFTVTYLKGKENVVADALSREAQELTVNAVEIAEVDGQFYGYEEIREAVTKDELYRLALEDDDTRLQLGVEKQDGYLITTNGQLCVPNDRRLRYQIVLEHP